MRIIDKIAVGSVLGLLLCSPVGAQETLGGLGAASGIGATLGAAGAGALTAGSAMKGKRGAGDRNAEMEGLMRETSPSGNNFRRFPTASTASAKAPTGDAINWGTGNGQEILNQLVSHRPLPQPVKVKRSPREQARYSRRLGRMTTKQRAKMIQAQYHPKPVNWIAHYMPEDRYKIKNGDWEYVSTETSPYYYRAWAPAMLKAPAYRVIGFHTWQDAMIAGYRPDPVTQPTPGAQFATLARIGRGSHFVEYVEYAYSGQVTPENFQATYRYATEVIKAVRAYPYALPLLPETLDKVFEATLTGNPNLIPRSIGGQPTSVLPAGVTEMSRVTNSNANEARAGGAPPREPEGQKDKREEEFNTFGRRAGNLANVPANSR